MTTVKSDSNSPIKPVSEFNRLHNKSFIIPNKIKIGLKKLADKKGWCYETDFTKLAEVSLLDLAAFREQFADDHIVVVKSESGRHPKRVWTGTRAMADELRSFL